MCICVCFAICVNVDGTLYEKWAAVVLMILSISVLVTFGIFFVILSLCVYVDGVSMEKGVVLLCVCDTKYFSF